MARKPGRVFHSCHKYTCTPRYIAKKEPGPSDKLEPGKDLATTYSRRTYRPTTIGAAAFHFRVRNGTGWFHHALVTRGRSWCTMAHAIGLQNRDSGGLNLGHWLMGHWL